MKLNRFKVPSTPCPSPQVQTFYVMPDHHNSSQILRINSSALLCHASSSLANVTLSGALAALSVPACASNGPEQRYRRSLGALPGRQSGSDLRENCVDPFLNGTSWRAEQTPCDAPISAQHCSLASRIDAMLPQLQQDVLRARRTAFFSQLCSF